MRLNSHTLALLAGEFKNTLTNIAAAGELGDGAVADSLALNLVELRGAAAMVELAGLRRLMDEAIGCCRDWRDGNLALEQFQPFLETALKILLRYIDYIIQAEKDSPCLLLPEINTLRKLRRLTPVYEYQLMTDVSWPPFPMVGATNEVTSRQRAEIGRLRHFYQLGLLDVIRGSGGKAFVFMARAADRLQDVVANDIERSYWSLVGRVVRAFGVKKLSLLPERLRLLSAVEQQLRLLAAEPGINAKRPYPEGLWRAFVALYALTPVGGDQDRALREKLQIPALGVTDADLAAIRKRLLGDESGKPDDFLPKLADLAGALHLRMDALHVGESVWTDDDIAFLREKLVDLAEVAAAHHLPILARRFDGHARELAGVAETGARLSEDQRQPIADSILAAEALVADFWERTPTAELLTQWDGRPLSVILQTGIIKTAQRTLLAEMSASLKQIKGSLTTLTTGSSGESSTADIDQAFGVIRANAFMLDLARLEQLAVRCRRFVRGGFFAGGGQLFTGGAAEAFADAIVSMEYYLDNYRPGESATDAALNLAEECLTALGV